MRALLAFCLLISLSSAVAQTADMGQDGPAISSLTLLAPAPEQPPLAAVLDCRSILGVVQRLGCYDAAVGADRGLGAKYRVGGGSIAPPPGRWLFIHRFDPFSEKERSSLRLALQGPLGDQQDRGLEAIDLQCDGEGGLVVSISAQRYLGVPGQAVSLRFRFGTGPVVEEQWPPAESGTAIVMPKAGSRFLDGLRGQGPVLIEVRSYRGQRLSARIGALGGAEQVWGHVAGGCPGARPPEMVSR